jgi:hypothetical protein
MSDGQVEIGEALVAAVKRIKDEHGFRTLTSAARYLIALGLAADWDNRSARFSSTNPFLEVAWEHRAKR